MWLAIWIVVLHYPREDLARHCFLLCHPLCIAMQLLLRVVGTCCRSSDLLIRQDAGRLVLLKCLRAAVFRQSRVLLNPLAKVNL